jgi:hypothetical protein
VTPTPPGRVLLFLRGRKSEINDSATYLFQIHMAMKSQLSKTLERCPLEKKGRCCILSLYRGLDEEEKSLHAAMPQAGYLKGQNR